MTVNSQEWNFISYITSREKHNGQKHRGVYMVYNHLKTPISFMRKVIIWSFQRSQRQPSAVLLRLHGQYLHFLSLHFLSTHGTFTFIFISFILHFVVIFRFYARFLSIFLLRFLLFFKKIFELLFLTYLNN